MLNIIAFIFLDHFYYFKNIFVTLEFIIANSWFSFLSFIFPNLKKKKKKNILQSVAW